MDAYERCRLPDDITHEHWVRYVFDHPVLSPPWWEQAPESGHLQVWHDEADPARTLSFLTQLFEHPEGLIGRFTLAQIDQALYFLLNDAFGHMYVLRNVDLPWPDRRRCLLAMIPLYTALIAPVYGNDLGHPACFMWWDIIPLGCAMPHPDRDRINDAVLQIFEQVLNLKAEACLESVLHGLGHWHDCFPDRTEPIVRRFLRRTDISSELRAYAEAAAVGAVQ